MANADASKAILITGASTGIGAACALHFDRLGYSVYATVRRAEDGTALSRQASSRLQAVILDVAEPATISAVKERLTAELADIGLFGLVNNAGIAVPCPLEAVAIDDLKRQFEVNVFGQVAVTQAFLPLLRKRRGRIVNMGSISGVTVIPTLGPYCASKFALEAINDALRLELQPWGIEVAIIEPGSIATPMWNKALGQADGVTQRLSKETEDFYTKMINNVGARAKAAEVRAVAPKVVIEAVEHALTSNRPRTRYRVGLDGRIHAFIVALLPDRWMDRLLSFVLGLGTIGTSNYADQRR